MIDRIYEADFTKSVASVAYALHVDPLTVAKVDSFDFAFLSACARIYTDFERRKAEAARAAQKK